MKAISCPRTPSSSRISGEASHGYHRHPLESNLTTCHRQILHDPKTYKDPMEFNPERFLASPESPTPEEDPRHAAFGYGRRTCPGSTLADAAVFVFAAMSLTVFDISHGAAGEGLGKMSLDELKANVSFVSGIVRSVHTYASPNRGWLMHHPSSPKPFDCVVKPRSAKAEALIRAVNDGQ